MSITARSARPASSSFGASVELPGSRTSSARAVGERRVDPGVDGVRLEVEDERQRTPGPGRVRFSVALAASRRERQERDGDRQRRGGQSHSRLTLDWDRAAPGSGKRPPD